MFGHNISCELAMKQGSWLNCVDGLCKPNREYRPPQPVSLKNWRTVQGWCASSYFQLIRGPELSGWLTTAKAFLSSTREGWQREMFAWPGHIEGTHPTLGEECGENQNWQSALQQVVNRSTPLPPVRNTALTLLTLGQKWPWWMWRQPEA